MASRAENWTDKMANSKTRSLKAFEAEAAVAFTGQGSPPIDFYSPFGPLIAKTRLPESLVEQVNRYADEVVSSDQSMEFILPEDVVVSGGEDSVAQQTANLIKRYLAGVENTVVKDVMFETFWIVSQYAGTPRPVHFHSGDISGVLYLKVPQLDNEPYEESLTYISGRQAGHINFLTGGKQWLSKTLISFKPEVGDLYVFPGWLLHGSEPFRGTGERRSMAFNAFATIHEL